MASGGARGRPRRARYSRGVSRSRPSLSVLVVFYDMRREAPRTLHSLSRGYQRGVDDLDYEVLAIDNGSTAALDEDMVRSHGPEFSYHRLDLGSPSPVGAMNHGARLARGEHLMLCVDGARILSPGALRESLVGAQRHPRPVVAILSWHLGPAPQDQSVQQGYSQQVEDRLLEDCDWRADGYRLFGCSALGHSSAGGWHQPIGESNALTLPRALFDELGGFDEGFRSPGGGLANLDLFRRACEGEGNQLVVVLGEGTFHQLHGGASTNAAPKQSPWQAYLREYEQLRGYAYEQPPFDPLYVGAVPPMAKRFLQPPTAASAARRRGLLGRLGAAARRLLGR